MDELTELRRKFDVEVEAHRQTVKSYWIVIEERNEARAKLNELAHSFMTLHNLAKDVVGPRTNA